VIADQFDRSTCFDVVTRTAVDPVHEGGSFLYAARFVHDLEHFFALSDAEKSELMGRQYGKVCPATLAYAADHRLENPMTEYEPNDSHLQRASGVMHRQSFPYQAQSECGLYFAAFAADATVFAPILQSMAGHTGFGRCDGVMTFSKAVTGNIYYCPSMPELDKWKNQSADVKAAL